MLRQVYIFNTKAANPNLQKAYLVNTLINFREKLRTFYKMNLLLEYQIKEYKYFKPNCDSFLQENDEMF